MRRSTNNSFQTGECTTAEYTENLADGNIKLRNTEFYGFYDGSDRYRSATGRALVNNIFPGRLLVYISRLFGGDYRVIDSDFISYALVYSYFEVLGICAIEYHWVLVREKIEDGSPEFDSMMSTVD